MAGIRKWIRSKLHSKPKAKKRVQQPVREHQESLPFLPETRRPLTRGSAHGDEEPDFSLLLQNYGLFGRVPYEIRRQILVEAFGGRTLHVDLSYRHPLVRKPRSAGASGSGENESAEVAARGMHHRHCDLGSELVSDTSRPRAWQWFGCVCHRRTGYSEIEVEQRYAANKFSRTIEPCDDECLEESESVCSCQVEQSDSSDGAACFVGVMGWLLACRQAYADGVDVLYSTNTLHFSSLDLQLNLPRLIPRHHLERVTSLELLWKLNSTEIRPEVPLPNYVKPLWDAGPDFQGHPDSPLHILCQMIPQTFPRLRRLYISFQCWLDSGSHGGADLISDVETIFLGPVEDMMRAYLLERSRQEGRDHGHNLSHGHGDLELNAAIQWGAWFTLLQKYHHLEGTKLKFESDDFMAWRGRFWKPLRLGSDAVTGSGSDGGGTGYEENGGEGCGYWICGGWQDADPYGTNYWEFVNWGWKWNWGGTTY